MLLDIWIKTDKTGNILINVTLRRFRVTTVAVEKQPWLSNTQCACATLYCHLWLLWLYRIFFTLSHKRHDFRNQVIEHKMCVLIISTTFAWNISDSKKKWARYHKISQAETSRVRFPMGVSRFLTDFIDWVDSASNKNNISWGYMRRTDNLDTFLCGLSRNSGGLNLLEAKRPEQG